MDGDLAATVVDRDLPGADARADPQARQRDRNRVAVLADRDQRLGVHARCRRLRRVERLGGQRKQQRPLAGPRLTDRPRAPVDPPVEVALAAGEQQRVELGQVRDLRDGDEVVAAMAADLALDAALLVGPSRPGVVNYEPNR
jgi:hypothetical protein